MMRKSFAHKCPTINASAKVNHFAHPEISRLGGFSAESQYDSGLAGDVTEKPDGKRAVYDCKT